MPGLVDVAWLIYSNSGPALNLVFIGMVVLGWRYQIQPRLDDLENQQDAHADDLQSRALNATERDVMLENAHERLDDHSDLHGEAEAARASLRERISRLEQREAWRSGGGGSGGGGAPPVGPGGADARQSVRTDGGDRSQAMTDGGGVGTQQAHGSDDDGVDLTLNVDVEGDAHIHVETSSQHDGFDSWIPTKAGANDTEEDHD